MTTRGVVVTHADDAAFARGLRAFFEYRDLGIRDATDIHLAGARISTA